jgi:signal peptidase I
MKEYYERAYRLADAVQGSIGVVADTGSMEPTISAKDLLVIKPVGEGGLDVSAIALGDIILFEAIVPAIRYTKYRVEYPKRLLCHRVVWLNKGRIYAKGDAKVERDHDFVRHQQIKGVVLYAVDGQTGEVRDMRVTREGVTISFDEALERHSFSR